MRVYLFRGMMFRKGSNFMGRDYLNGHQVMLESIGCYPGNDIMSKLEAIPQFL